MIDTWVGKGEDEDAVLFFNTPPTRSKSHFRPVRSFNTHELLASELCTPLPIPRNGSGQLGQHSCTQFSFPLQDRLDCALSYMTQEVTLNKSTGHNLFQNVIETDLER